MPMLMDPRLGVERLERLVIYVHNCLFAQEKVSPVLQVLDKGIELIVICVVVLLGL